KEINQKGFSLLELTLVLGIGTVIAFVKFQDMKTNQGNMMADTVGNQIKQIEVSRYRGNECNNGGSNCREPDRRLYTCN
ncbi:shufflon system plasmid conjugative transfer pilus tip adhesin PilV, partial [Salmonella enterica]|nr:shufflon system plasmid conjugative transfer pilus tip adhesin PilV [Salmonella enterica]